MSAKEMFVCALGILAVTILASMIITACAKVQYKNADTSRQAKIACIQAGGAWDVGTCVYSKVSK